MRCVWGYGKGFNNDLSTDLEATTETGTSICMITSSNASVSEESSVSIGESKFVTACVIGGLGAVPCINMSSGAYVDIITVVSKGTKSDANKNVEGCVGISMNVILA